MHRKMVHRDGDAPGVQRRRGHRVKIAPFTSRIDRSCRTTPPPPPHKLDLRDVFSPRAHALIRIHRARVRRLPPSLLLDRERIGRYLLARLILDDDDDDDVSGH